MKFKNNNNPLLNNTKAKKIIDALKTKKQDNKPIDKPIVKPIDKPIMKPIDKSIRKSVVKPIDKPVIKKVTKVKPTVIYINTIKEFKKLKAKPNMIFFYYADYCSWCHAIRENWDIAKSSYYPKKKTIVEINFGKIRNDFDQKGIDKRLKDVNSVPYINAFDNKNIKILYDDDRSVQSLSKFILHFG